MTFSIVNALRELLYDARLISLGNHVDVGIGPLPIA